MPSELSWEQIRARQHPILPDPERYRLRSLTFDFGAGGSVSAILVTLESSEGAQQHLRFTNPTFSQETVLDLSPSIEGFNADSAIRIVDIADRQWESAKLEVVGDHEEAPIYFWAESVSVSTPQ